jgi:hypothetical protein
MAAPQLHPLEAALQQLDWSMDLLASADCTQASQPTQAIHDAIEAVQQACCTLHMQDFLQLQVSTAGNAGTNMARADA